MNSSRLETLVIVERDSRLGIEVREFVMEGDRAFLIFARSDGSECRVEIDASNLRPVPQGRIEVDYQYRGGVIRAPQQEVGT